MIRVVVEVAEGPDIKTDRDATKYISNLLEAGAISKGTYPGNGYWYTRVKSLKRVFSDLIVYGRYEKPLSDYANTIDSIVSRLQKVSEGLRTKDSLTTHTTPQDV